MTDDATRAAYQDAERAAGKIPGILEGLVERLGAHAGAGAVFGEPVERAGRTVIPVAQSVIGTGAGGGDMAGSDEGSGLGAGGGAITRPLGYIEVTEHSAAFVPLSQPWQDPKVILAYTFMVLVAGRLLVKLVRG